MKKNECEACSGTGQVLDGERCGFCDHEKPSVLFGDVCMKDAEELRDIAAYFDSLGKKPNGDFLREVANRHEILAGAYQSSTMRYERELKEWIERGRTPEEKEAALKWLEDMRNMVKVPNAN